jgi:hypothetical protein
MHLELTDGKTHVEIDPVLMDRSRHSNILDALSFRNADRDTDYYLMVLQVRERLAGSKQATTKFDMERFNPENGKEQF